MLVCITVGSFSCLRYRLITCTPYLGVLKVSDRGLRRRLVVYLPRHLLRPPSPTLTPTSRGEEGGGTASLKVGTHCQTTTVFEGDCPYSSL